MEKLVNDTAATQPTNESSEFITNFGVTLETAGLAFREMGALLNVLSNDKPIHPNPIVRAVI